MTISSTIRKAGPFIGNGSTTSFPFAFKIFETSDLLVVLLDEATNTETTLVLNSNYTATMNGDQNGNPGGTVTLIAGALASGYTLTITSDLANLQPTDLTNQGGFYPDVINDALDRSTVQIQQLQEQTDRSLKIAVSSTANVTLPPESANQLLGWDATGQNLANIDPGTLATIVAYATAYADTFTGDGTTVNWVLSHDPAVLYNLDVSINGVTQVPTVDYTLAGTTFTTTTAAPTGAVILVKYSQALPNMSADSQDVRYLPPFTGSTSTTVEAKLAQTVSVKDFGAVGDGVTDDTAAIQAALNFGASNNKSVFFPDGTFKINTGLTTSPGCGIAASPNAALSGASGITVLTLTNGNYASVPFNLPTILGGAVGLKLLGANLASINVPVIAGTGDAIVLQIDNSNLGVADNTIRFQSIFACTGSAIKFNFIATSKTGTLMQGNAFYGNFITNVLYGIYFYDVNNGALGSLYWDDSYFEIIAIDTVKAGSIGIYGNPNLPPRSSIFFVPGFFGGVDVAYIKGGSNNCIYKLAFDVAPAYSKMQLTGFGNTILNVASPQDGIRGIEPGCALMNNTGSIGTFNGGSPLNSNRFLANITIGQSLSSVVITGTAGQFSCSAASLAIGQPVTITGTFGGTGSISGYVSGTTYYIIATNGTTTFTLSTTLGGTAITTTAGTPTGLTYSAGLATGQNQGFIFYHPLMQNYGCKVTTEPLWYTAPLLILSAVENSTAGAGIAPSPPEPFAGYVYTYAVGAVVYGTYKLFITVHSTP